MKADKEEFIKSLEEYKGIINKISFAYTNNHYCPRYDRVKICNYIINKVL